MLRFKQVRTEKIAICVAAALLTLIAAAVAKAQPTDNSVKIKVVGSSVVGSENAASARDKAVAEALRTAVEQVAIHMLSPGDLAVSFSGLVRTVFSNPDRFVETYKVITEAGRTKTYVVLVEVTVSKELLRQTLSTDGILAGEKKTVPKVLVVLIEKALNGVEPPAWIGEDTEYYQSAAEKAVKSALEQKKMDVVNRGGASDKLKNTVIPFTPDYNLQDLLAVGERMEADIVVAGRARAEIVPNTMQGNMKSYKGEIRMKAFRVDTGQEIAETEESAIKAHTDEELAGPEVLAAAGQTAGRLLADQIASKWRTSAEMARFEMVIGGTRQLANFVQFRRMIEALPAVRNVLTKEMKSNEAILSVDAAGGPKKIADEIMVESFDAFGVDIYSLSDTEMKVTLVPR